MTPNAKVALSPRERQVLRLVCDGKSSKEIGHTLGVQSTSVDTYRSRLMAKVGVGNVVELVRWAIRQKMVKA